MNPLINNWTYGEVSPKFGGRFDLSVYQQGCETLENFRPMKQGGITRRPPLKHLASCDNSRLIPFTLSGGESFILEFYNQKLSIWKEDDGVFTRMTFNDGSSDFDYTASPYKDTELWSFQYAQYYDRMYFVHKSHMQKCLYFHAGAVPYFSFEDFAIVTDEGENLGKSGYSQHYPSVVAICQNRLWLGSTTANPYTIWASRPYEDIGSHADFTTIDIATTEVEVLKDPSEWPIIIDEDDNESYDLTDATKLIEVITDTEEVVTARCAMELELASGRNDKISWISSLNNIMVGTEASEWLLPYDIDPTKQSASRQSSFGCMHIQPVMMNDGLFFIQNGTRLREYVAQEGNLDHSFTADHLLSNVTQVVTTRSPDPTVFLLQNDGTLIVFVYDRAYGIQAWARWKTEGKITSIAIKEYAGGKEQVICVVKRDSSYYLEYFDYNENKNFIDRYEEIIDGTEPTAHSNLDYLSKMVGNRLDFVADDGVSIGRSKKIKEVWLRCLNSGKLKTGVSDNLETTVNEVGSNDYRVMVSGGSRKELSVIVESYESDPLTLLAMTYNVEVN